MSETRAGDKKRRSRLGCETCRARKVRCDERSGRCANCERLGLECKPSWRSVPSTAPLPITSQYAGVDSLAAVGGTKRKRTYRSCSECRMSKTRCSGHKPVCTRCTEKSLSCAYEDDSEPVWKQRVARKSPTERHPPADPLKLVDSPRNSSVSSYPKAETPATTTGIASPSTSIHLHHKPHFEDSAWLSDLHLPSHSKIRILVERYFTNVHHLRCFAFLHKPSFLQKLDSDAHKNQDANPLLHIVCALGALFYAAEQETSGNLPLPINPLDAGKHWAHRAQTLILGRLDKISVEHLMAAVLLHDYEIRLGSYSNAFMLSAITARMAQALQINLEHSTDVLCREAGSAPSASVKESRRRLMWCCYITDSLVGSGIDQLTMIDESDIKIQLPCTERNFVLEEPCITETLEVGQTLNFLSSDLLPSYPQDCMGMTAFYIRHIATRRKVLKYIKHLDVAKPPWLPDSEFARLDAELRYWYDNLPANLQFTPNTLYIRQETSQVGALCALHYAYHQTMCDLYRIGAPGLYRLRSAIVFPPEQADFLRNLQSTLFGHARSLATIMAEALRHGPHAIADSWLPTILYDSCKIMLFYLTHLIDPAAESSKILLAETIPHVRNNVKALKIMRSMYSAAATLSAAADTMLEKVGIESEHARQTFIPEDPYSNNEPDDTNAVHSAPGTPAQSAPDYILNPLSIYNLARLSIPEKHAPQKQPGNLVPPPTSTATLSHPPHSATQQAPSHDHPTSPHHLATPSDPSPYAPLPVPPQQQRPDQQHPDPPHDDTLLAPELRSTPVPLEHINFDELQSLFISDPTSWTWQPAETAVGSRTEAAGLPPWESSALDGQLDAWIPSFALDSDG